MKGQKGQSLVEFALLVPLVLLLVLGMIYGAFAYSDYLQYSSAVRDAARDIAVQDTAERSVIISGLNDGNSNIVGRYVNPITELYRAEFDASAYDEERNGTTFSYVTVRVSFRLNKNISVLPESLSDVQCTMPMERDLKEENTDGKK